MNQPTAELSLMEHLVELRDRIVRAVIALFIGTIPAFYFAKDVRRFLSQPMLGSLPADFSKPVVRGALDLFTLDLKLALLVAVFITSPYLFYQAWAFVSPGLHEHEKKYVLPFISASTVFFVIGAAFCYLVCLPAVFAFGVNYMGDDVLPMLDLEENLAMSAKLMLAFGITFELPTFIFLLAAAGLVTPEWLTRYRRHAIVLAFVVAAVLTPPDIVSQLMLAFPTVLLFELGVIAAKFVAKKPASETKAA
jgi:sec-independent protein translocase protein TatC